MSADAPEAVRPNSRGHHPRYTPADRREVLEVLRDKGVELKPPYAALCIVAWLHDRGHDAATSADVKALFPSARDGLAAPLRNAADVLRRARESGMLESLGEGWYRITPLGRAVVDVLPDGSQVGALRGCRTAACATRSGAVRRAATMARYG